MSEISKVSFGLLTAEQEIDFLLYQHGFVKTPTFESLRADHTRIFVGRKGGGKSANRICLLHIGQLIKDFSDELLLTKLDPFEFFSCVCNLEQTIGPVSRTKLLRNIWRYTIGLRLMREVRNSRRALPESTAEDLSTQLLYIRDYLESTGFGAQENREPSLIAVTKQLNKLVEAKPQEWQNADVSEDFPTDAKYDRAEASLRTILRAGAGALVVIDDFDKWLETETYLEMLPLVAGAIHAVALLMDDRLSGCQLRIKIFLPEDLFRKMAFRHMDTVQANWEWFVWDNELFKEFIARRIAVGIGSVRAEMKREQMDYCLGRVFPGWPKDFLVKDEWDNHRDPLNFILFYTHYRPRDVLTVLHHVKEAWKQRGKPGDQVRPEDVTAGVMRARPSLAKAIIAEYSQRMPYLDDLLGYFVSKKAAMPFSEFENILATAAATARTTEELTIGQLVRDLYEMGFFGKFVNPNDVYPERIPVQVGMSSDYVLFSYAKAETHFDQNDVVMIHPVFWTRLEMKRPRELCRGVIDPYITRQVVGS